MKKTSLVQNNKIKPSVKGLAASIVAIMLSGNALAEISVEDIQLTDKTRVSRTDFKYEFDITITNTGDDVQNIMANVSSNNVASDVSQTSLSLAALEADQQGTMTGKLVLVQNRRVRFVPSDLVWSFDYDEVSAGNPIEATFASDSAYVQGTHTNHFVARGLATEEEVDNKVNAAYAQLFELIEASTEDETDGDAIVGFEDTFDGPGTSWSVGPDNGTGVTVVSAVEDGRLVIVPTWSAPGDAIAVKFQQFAAVDISGGANISYDMQADAAYANDGNMAVQLILEDENYNPAFFAYRNINNTGNQSFSVEGIDANFSYGYISPDFDFTKVAGIGFQFLANNKAADVGGDISIDNVKLTTAPAVAAPEATFVDSFDDGISNWNASADNGSSVAVSLSTFEQQLVISPTWASSGDAFTVKYQQFDATDMTSSATVCADVKLPANYATDGNLAIQLVIEDINYQPGYLGYSSVNGRPGDEFFTLCFEDVNPASNFGYIGGSFDFTQLAGVGFQFVANGKAADIGGDIVIDNVVVSAAASDAGPVQPTSNTSVLFATADDMAFIKAIDSDDIRSEGMSYGMMVAVMMNDQVVFDKLWSFSKTYMQNKDGNTKDFFAWQLRATPPYTPLDTNPAPDGEEYFAMALMFANNRWGSREGIFDYQTEANDILHDMIYTQTDSTRLMMHPVYQQIEFLTGLSVDSFTDPSYHLPAFYELWALWAEENNDYWHQAAQVSRDFLETAAHPVTGLFSDYASHEGEPKITSFNPFSHKSAYDSYRVIGNLAMDYHWISKSPKMLALIDRQVSFFKSEIEEYGNFVAVYDLDGTREPGITFRGEGRNAMNGFGATASEQMFSDQMLKSLWDQSPPSGEFRYYDGLLYMMSLLHASGEFKIHKPE